MGYPECHRCKQKWKYIQENETIMDLKGIIFLLSGILQILTLDDLSTYDISVNQMLYKVIGFARLVNSILYLFSIIVPNT